MTAPERFIGYGATFPTSFSGLFAQINVISPVNTPLPVVSVTLTQSATKDTPQRIFRIKGEDFEDLVKLLVSTKEHLTLFNGADFGFLGNDSQPLLHGDVGTAQIIVRHQKGGMLSSGKYIVTVYIDNVPFERELNDQFFNELNRLQWAIYEAKKRVGDRIATYINAKQ